MLKIPRTIKNRICSFVLVAGLLIAMAAGMQTDAARLGTKIEIAIPELGPVELQTLPNGEVVVNMGEFPQGGRPGDPMLSYYRVCLLVPPDADLATAKAELVSGNWEELPGEHQIAPASPAATWDGQKPIVSWGPKDESVIVNGRDSTIYGKDAYFPGEAVQVVYVGLFRQWKLVEFRVWLAVYNPVKKKVRVLGDARAALSVQKLPPELATGLNSASPPVLPGADKFVPELLSRVANPQDMEKFYGSLEGASRSNTDYIIITTNTIVNNSTKLDDFISAKQALGYSVKVVTEGPVANDTHYVGGSDCDERADNIRSWLDLYCLKDGTEYVLLIGDPHPDVFDSDTSVPMKMCWPRHGAVQWQEAPSDMFFAELSNTWDLDEDGFYGEYPDDYGAGGADKDCEVKLGRIPFYNDNYTDLDSILQKTIDYRNASGNLPWRGKVLIAAAISNFSPQDDTGDGEPDQPFVSPVKRTFGAYWGEAIKLHGSSVGFTQYTLYEKTGVYDDGSAYPLTASDAQLTNDNFVNEWQNYYGFVSWWAHGTDTSAWRFCWEDDSSFIDICGNCAPHLETNWYTFFESLDCAQLDDEHPSFVVQASCDNGYPETSDNLGYSLLKQGAVGTISATRVSWYYVGAWMYWGITFGDNASYGYYCCKRMTEFDESIGEALRYCRKEFGFGWGSQSWMNMIEFSLYGDPELKLRTGWLFCVKDNSDKPVAWFDTLGNLFLKGSKQEEWKLPDGQVDEFIIERNNGPTAYIDDSGNLFLQGEFTQGSAPSATGADEFRIQDSEGNDVAIIKASNGDVHIKGKLYENREQ